MPRADADGLSLLHIADGIGLGVFQSDQGDLHIDQGGFWNVLILCYDMGEQILVDVQLVSPLFKSNAIHLLAFDGGGLIGGIDPDDIIISLFLGL